MSTDDDRTTPIPTGRYGDQPTAPLPRPGAGRSDGPPPVAATSGRRDGDDDAVVEEPAATDARPGAAPAGTGATAVPAPGDRAERPALRVGTVVWGLVVALVGVGAIAVAAGARFDPELALIALLAVAGTALVAGSVAAGVRRRG